MARQLDPGRLKCDAGHDGPVVAFATRDGLPVGPWYACCAEDLDDLPAGFVYVRFRPGPDDHNSAGTDALKSDDGPADNPS